MHAYRNSFHNTEAKSKYSRADMERAIDLWHSRHEVTSALKAAQRLQHKLCGRSGCICGNGWGERR